MRASSPRWRSFCAPLSANIALVRFSLPARSSNSPYELERPTVTGDGASFNAESAKGGSRTSARPKK